MRLRTPLWGFGSGRAVGRRRLRWSPPVRSGSVATMVPPVRDYIAKISVSEADRRVLETAGISSTPLAWRDFQFLRNERKGGPPYAVPDDEPHDLTFHGVRSGEISGAVADAKRVYAEARRYAGLCSHAPSSVTVEPMEELVHWPRHYALLSSAYAMREREENAHAVVAAQAACEVCAERAIGDLLRRRKLGPFQEIVLEYAANYSMLRGPSQEVWLALTLERFTAAPGFAEYKEHVERRNKIVHKGADVTWVEAEASLAAARGFLDYVERTAGPLLI